MKLILRGSTQSVKFGHGYPALCFTLSYEVASLKLILKRLLAERQILGVDTPHYVSHSAVELPV